MAADTLSVLDLNIRSIKKNFENFKFFLLNLSFDFSIVSWRRMVRRILVNISIIVMSYLIIKAFIKLETMAKGVGFLFT